MRSREGYTFAKETKYERSRESEGRCEVCGRRARLQAHHLVGCYFAARNPLLLPQLIRSIENAQSLCPNCHKKADEDHKHWTPHDVGFLAWALFDLDPMEVAEAQRGTYLDKCAIIGNGRRKKKDKRKYHRRSGKRVRHGARV